MNTPGLFRRPCSPPITTLRRNGTALIAARSTSRKLSFELIFSVAVLHSGIRFSFSGLMCAGRGCPLFSGHRFLYAKSNVSQFKETAAIRRAARTVLPRALACRPLEAIARRYPKVLGDLRLLVRFFGHSCGLLSATHQPFSTTKMRFFSSNLSGFTAFALVRRNCIQSLCGTEIPKRETGSATFRGCFDCRNHAFRHPKLMPFPAKNERRLMRLRSCVLAHGPVK